MTHTHVSTQCEYCVDEFYTLLTEEVPNSYSKVVSSSDAPFETEFNGYKWVFRNKLKLDGSIDKYNTRLIAK